MLDWLKRLPNRIWRVVLVVGVILGIVASCVAIEDWVSKRFPGLSSALQKTFDSTWQWIMQPVSIARGLAVLITAILVGAPIFLVWSYWRARQTPVTAESLSLPELYVLVALGMKDGQPLTTIEVARWKAIDNLKIELAMSQLIQKKLVIERLVMENGETSYLLTDKGKALAVSTATNKVMHAKEFRGGG